MGNVSVSRESLHKVKMALRDFQASVESSTDHMRAHLEEVAVSIQASIKKQQEAVASLKNKITRLASDIEHCQTQIIGNNNQITVLKGRIESISSRIRELDNETAKLRAQKQQLMSQGRPENSDGNSNGAQLNNIENRIRDCERKKKQLNEQKSSLCGQERSLNEQNAALRSNKIKLDAALEKTKGEHEAANNKCERMKSVGYTARSRIVGLSGTMQQYRQKSLSSSSTYTSEIDKCIVAIDEYESVNLSRGRSSGEIVGSGRSGGSGNFGSELPRVAGNIRQILNENPPELRENMLFELSVLRNDLELTEGNPALPQLGGSYGEVRKQLRGLGIIGYAAHHIPSAASQGASYNENREYYESLPTIAVSSADHRETNSFGGRQGSRYQSFLPDVPVSDSYRNDITAEIENGNFIGIVRNELYNIRDYFGHDYDGGISRYLDALESFLQNN